MAKTIKLRPSFAMIPSSSFMESPINANEMSQNKFARLVRNLKEDGCLTSAVLAIAKGERWMVISGHHRVAAARQAGVKEIPALCLEEGAVSESKRIALQISHNAINGETNPNTLLELIEELNTEDVAYSGVSFEIDTQDIPQMPIPEIAREFDYRHIVVCVQPNTLDRFDRFLAAEEAVLAGDERILIDAAEWEKMKELLTRARSLGWRTPGAAFGNLLERLEGVIGDG